MQKWEYLLIRARVDSGPVVDNPNLKGITFEPRGKFDLGRLASWLQRYPKVNITTNEAGVWFQSRLDLRYIFVEVIDYVCSEGWEPFASGNGSGYMHFRRPR